MWTDILLVLLFVCTHLPLYYQKTFEESIKTKVKSECYYPFPKALTDRDAVWLKQCESMVQLLKEPDATTYEEAEAFYKDHYGDVPKSFKRWYEFASANQCKINRYDKLYEHLKPFRGGSYDLQWVMDAFDGSEQLNKVSIVNGHVDMSSHSTYAKWYDPIFDRLKAHLPNMTFLINVHAHPIVYGTNSTNATYTKGSTSDKLLHKESGTEAPFHDFLDQNCQSSTFYEDMKKGHGLFLTPVPEYKITYQYPMISWGKWPNCNSDILTPSPFHYKRLQTMGEKPWAEKKNKLVWRGATSGGHFAEGQVAHPKMFKGKYNDKNWFYSHRQRAVTMAMMYPDQLDMAFTGYVESKGQSKEEMKSFYHTKPWMDFHSNKDYKMILDIDGNGYSARFPSLFMGNSLVFGAHYATDFTEDTIIPFYHYIPVSMGFDTINEDALSADMKQVLQNGHRLEGMEALVGVQSPIGYADLVPKVLAMRDDPEAEAMAKRGYEMAKSRLRSEDMDCYLLRALYELETILK